MQSNTDRISSLTEQNENLGNYFANTIIPQLFVDEKLVLRKFTPPALKQFNLRDEYVGRTLEEIKENFRYPTIIENIKFVILTGKILEKEIQTTDMRWYQMNILPYVVRKDKKPMGVIITFVDITQRIQDLKEQETLVAELELLVDTIAHDIKNPISAIGISLQLINRLPEKRSEKSLKLHCSLESSLADMKNVIDELVASHWQRHRYQSPEQLLDIQSIIEDVRVTLAPQILDSHAIITEDLTVTEITFVRRKLRSLIYNLLSNAIKYRSPDRSPIIGISTYEEHGMLVLKVSDNGKGISEMNKELIFEKFKRIRSSVEGSGVGLYLVNTIVSNSGGKIEVESEVGRGTVFKIFLSLNETAIIE